MAPLPSKKVLGTNLQSARIQLTARANELKKQGANVLDLTGYVVDHPYGPVRTPPDYVFEAMKNAIEKGWPQAELRGTPGLRQAIAKLEENDKGIEVDWKSEVIVTSGGGMQALYNALQVVLDIGDEVICFAPGLNYSDQARLAGGSAITLNLNEEDDFRFDWEAVENSISPRTRAIIVNTPHNPTGHVAKREELEGIAELACRHNLLVLSDEILWKWVYGRERHISLASLPGMKERTLILSGATKAGMFDWRIGWVLGPAFLINQFEKVMFWQNEFAPPMLQVAAEAHLTRLTEWIQPIVKDFERRRDYMMTELRGAGFPCVEPKGHLATFPNTTRFAKNSTEFANSLLEKAHVLVTPGVTYLDERHIRVGFGGNTSPQQIHEAFGRILEMKPLVR